MLKNGIFSVLKANLIALLFNLLTSFLLPKYLSVDAYAFIKTFQLYVSYIGVLHFGYSDGTYLKFGGKELDKVSTEILLVDIMTMRCLEIFVSILTIILCVALQDYIWIAFAISVLPLNMTSYYKSLCQATGEFKTFGKLSNWTTILTFITNMILLFAIRVRENYMPYIYSYALLNIAIWVCIEIYTERILNIRWSKKAFSIKVLISNVKNGALLLLGNLSTTLFTSMDRWFVKALLDLAAFAQYSFAVSIENFMNIAVTPLSITFYNYFCNHKSHEDVEYVQGMVFIFAAVLPACAFPAKWILEHYLHQYIGSVDVLFYIFAAQMYAIVVKCIYINLYKAQHKQHLYFFKLVAVLCIGVILNMICYKLLGTKESFAIGTLVSNIIWFVLAIIDFPESMPRKKMLLYIICETFLFLVSGIVFSSLIGGSIYVGGSVLLISILMKKPLNNIVIIMKSMLKTIKSNHKANGGRRSKND